MIIIPMVGKSSRFYNEGYKIPKYELKIENHSVFYYAVRSFKNYFENEFFLFIVRGDNGAELFVRHQIKLLNIKNFFISVLNNDTNGQADTVYQGLERVKNQESLYIFNIDTFRPNFIKPKIALQCDGFLEVFEGEGENWSFVQPGENNKVIKTTEKNRISNLCSNGLYYFKNRQIFEETFKYSVMERKMDKDEYYIAPLYNYLINKGMDIRYEIISKNKIIFCGTPKEYLNLVSKK